MYIRITTNQQGQAYYHLVESYRENGKVRQRKLLSLGKVGEDRLDTPESIFGKSIRQKHSRCSATNRLNFFNTIIYNDLYFLGVKLGNYYAVELYLVNRYDSDHM